MNSPSSFTELSADSQRLETRFRALKDGVRSPDFEGFATDLHQWLISCIDHGRYLPPGTPERRTLQGQVDYWTSRLLRAGHAFDDIDRIAAFDPTAGRALPDDQFPYHGLLAVTEKERALFFGREEQTREYVAHLEQHAALLIQSESGGGKSSVAMAGVLPELQLAHPEWRVLPRVTPGSRPADTLRAALAALLALPVDAADGLDAAAVRTALNGDRLLVYVDQLEELLTICTDVRQQADFSELLAALGDTGDLRLLATLRIDHYDRLAHSAACHRLFTLLTQAGSVRTLTSMSLAQIRSVILKPAQAVGLRFVPASIVETLASESANAPSGLPLLQFALQRLWQERPHGPQGEPLDLITDATYAKLPTLRTALGAVAQRYYDQMAQRGLAEAFRRLMLELTVIDERLEVPLRRRRSESEVIGVLVNAGLADDARSRDLIDGFVTQRLIVRTGEGGGCQIEVAHEALFRHWDRFQEWINSDEVRVTLHEVRETARDAVLWDQGQRSPDLLKLRGAPLEDALRHRRAHWLDKLTAEYVDACGEAALAQQRRDVAAQQALDHAEQAKKHEQQASRRAARLGVALIVLAVAGVFGFVFIQQRRDAAEQLADNTMASVIPLLRGLEALDLAYTLKERSGSPAPLAYAVDRLANGMLLGNRADGQTSFTPSGQAAFQLIRKNGRVEAASIMVPLPLGMDPARKPVSIRLERKPQEDLAFLDVGPPIRTEKNAHLVIAVFIGHSLNDGTAPELTRMVAYRINKDGLEAEKIDEEPFPPATVQASNIAFDESGRGTAVAVLVGHKSPVSKVLRWFPSDGTPNVTPVSENGPQVTAVAFGGAEGRQLVAGRSDGSIDCGTTTVLTDDSKSPVRVLHAAAGTTNYVALHDSNSLSVVDCGTAAVVHARGAGVVQPQTPTLDANGDGKTLLSYTLGGKLVCSVVGEGIAGTCFGDGLTADQAVPVFDAQHKRVGYHALPDSAEPLLMFLDAGTGMLDTESHPTPGLPTVRLSSVDSDGSDSAAASPKGEYQATIETADAGKAARTLRVVPLHGSNGRTHGVLKQVEHPEQVAVNDDGTAVVLKRNMQDASHQLVLEDANADAISIPLGFQAVCMKMSPDGKRVVVASERGDSKAVAVGPAGGAREIALHGNGSGNLFSDVVSACAIGGGERAAAVLALRDGKVLQSELKPDTEWKPVSELVPFRVGSAALDVSIDAESRFVAVIGERLASNCPNGMDGHPLRIWDLRSHRPDSPVASTCLTRQVGAIGALEKKPGRPWVLPVYEVREKRLRRFDYTCQACGKEGKGYDSKSDDDFAGKYQPKPLSPDRVKDLYGLAP